MAFALVELDSVPGNPVGAHEVAEDAGMLDLDVLEHQEFHRRALPRSRLPGRAAHQPEPPVDPVGSICSVLQLWRGILPRLPGRYPQKA